MTPRKRRPAWLIWRLRGDASTHPHNAAMLIFRWIVLLLGVAGLLCFAMYIGTRNDRWRGLGVRIIQWTVVAGLGFFAVLLLERMAIIL